MTKEREDLKYPLLAVDLDGTLFTDEKEIQAETIEAILEYREKGGKVVISSGRSPMSTKWVAETIGIACAPIIAYNGEVILDQHGEIHEQSVFQHDTLLTFWELCEAAGHYAQFYEGDTLLVPAVNEWNQNWIENNIPLLEKSGGKRETCEGLRKKCEVKVIDHFYQYIKEKQPAITKIAVFDKGEKLQDFSIRFAGLESALEISSSFGFRNLEITPSGISKASALIKVTQLLGIPISQTAAIGDNFNDSLMLETAGFGIVMGNAPEEVKQTANAVTDTNNEAGVAKAIRKYLLL